MRIVPGPHRALVPRLWGQMVLVNGLGLPILCQSANPVPIGQSSANRPIWCQSGANRAFCHLCKSYFKLPVQCHSAKAVPILQTYCQYASQMKMHKFNFDILTLHYLSPHTMLMCQSGAHLPIQRQSCTEIAYYGMPVSPSVNGRAVDRCIATESGLAQHWPPV